MELCMLHLLWVSPEFCSEGGVLLFEMEEFVGELEYLIPEVTVVGDERVDFFSQFVHMGIFISSIFDCCNFLSF